MTVPAELGGRAWQAALALVGTPFRLHGRDPAHGLDCVGVIIAAYRHAGHSFVLPDPDYRFGGHALASAWQPLTAAGFRSVTDANHQMGDIAVQLWPGGRLHLLMCGPDGAVHAHAGLRRVVFGLQPPDDDLHGRWRLAHPMSRHGHSNGD